jgi:ATP-dependent Clp protease protease subunit
MRKFWNWLQNENGGRTLLLTGPIAEETWFGDEVTPARFKDELDAEDGAVTVQINSPGGDVFAAVQIYNLLRAYAGAVTVTVDALAASAATIVMMAGDTVLLSPAALVMIHNPSTVAVGDSEEMLRAKAMLDEVKESIINAYRTKTKLSRDALSELMDAETWLNAQKAIKLGFADGLLEKSERAEPLELGEDMVFSRRAVTASLVKRLCGEQPQKSQPTGVPVAPLLARLENYHHTRRTA